MPYLFIAAFDAPDWQKEAADSIADGTADEVEINSAIGRLATTGGIVELSLGTFNIESHVDISINDLTFRGQGPGTLLRKTGSDTWSVVNQRGANHHIVVQDIHIDGRDIGGFLDAGNKALFINGDNTNYVNSHHILIQRVVAHNASAEGVCVDYSQEVTIQDCESYDNAWAGIAVAQVKTARVLNNHCSRNGRGGPSGSLGAGINAQGSEHVLISGNHVERSHYRGIGVTWYGLLDAWPGRDITIQDNVLEDNARYPQIHIWSPNNDRSLEAVRVVGNFITNTDTSSMGIWLDNVLGFQVLQNTVDGRGPYPIYGGPNAAEGIVRDNLIGSDYGGPIRFLNDTAAAYEIQTMSFVDLQAADPQWIVNRGDCAGTIPKSFPILRQPDVPRQLTWRFDTHQQVSAFAFHFVGVDSRGRVVNESFTQANGWSGTTDTAYSRIDLVRLYARTGSGIGDTLSIGIGDALGLGVILDNDASIVRVVKNGVDFRPVWFHADTSLLNVGTIQTGDKLLVYYEEPLNLHF